MWRVWYGRGFLIFLFLEVPVSRRIPAVRAFAHLSFYMWTDKLHVFYSLQALGAIAFAIGVWGVVVGRDYDTVTGSETVSAAALILVGGLVTMAVSFVGIVGACAMWRPLLVIVRRHSHTHTQRTLYIYTYIPIQYVFTLPPNSMLLLLRSSLSWSLWLPSWPLSLWMKL